MCFMDFMLIRCTLAIDHSESTRLSWIVFSDSGVLGKTDEKPAR